MNFLVKTKGGSNPKGKPRVYFTCHPEDLEKYLDKICEDIFKTHDCAIYYTENMFDEIEAENRETDLGQMNLFVIPVTFKLLMNPNRAMDSDYAYADQKNIPVLPIMMESGLDAIYARPDKFGERQYLNPFSTDLTAITYEEKLKKYLESVLISDETAKKVRAAFDAYIFLSYRKKDRRYANELMRLIHNKPEFRDIAIWFDEFLTPGESFKENIDKMLKDSKLFTLLVTPNLLEEPDGKPNFVMANEYPQARDSGMDILPTEMEKTDKADLNEKYKGIPECIDPHDDEAFRERLLNSLSNIATSANDDDPEHNYLIGLAYLDGIDVEINKDRGIDLITKAAESELPDAMKKLYYMYSEGQYVTVDYRKACYFAERIFEYSKRSFGESHPTTLVWHSNLAYTYENLGDYQKALKLQEKVYNLCCEILGEDHPDTLTSLNNLASTYGDLGDYRKEAEFEEKVYKLRCKILGEDHPDTLTSLNNLAGTYGDLGNYQKALELKEKVYELSCKVLGEDHPDTLRSLNNLAVTYSDLGDHQKALELKEKVYKLRCKILGEEHSDTLTSLGNLAYTYEDLGDHQKALELEEKVYELRCKVLGEEHPNTLTSLNNLAITYGDLGDYRKEAEFEEKVYKLRCKILGEDHPDTLRSLNNLASTYGDLGDHQKALELKEKVYKLCCKILGEDHPDTLTSLSNLAITYGDLGYHKKAIELTEKLYELRCKIWGKDNSKTLTALHNLAYYYGEDKEYGKAIELFESVYKKKCNLLGSKDNSTLATLLRLAQSYEHIGKYESAVSCYGKLYEFRLETLGKDDAKTVEAKDMLDNAKKHLWFYNKKSLGISEWFKKIFKQ